MFYFAQKNGRAARCDSRQKPEDLPSRSRDRKSANFMPFWGPCQAPLGGPVRSTVTISVLPQVARHLTSEPLDGEWTAHPGGPGEPQNVTGRSQPGPSTPSGRPRRARGRPTQNPGVGKGLIICLFAHFSRVRPDTGVPLCPDRARSAQLHYYISTL